ncbi:MAG: MoaD/ThiS family protein [Bacteroidota bacterium]
MSKIIIPTPLRKFTNFESSVEISGTTVLEAVKDLTSQHPDIKNHLLDTTGKLRSFIRIFVGDSDILTLDREHTKIESSTVISIVPAIAGG